MILSDLPLKVCVICGNQFVPRSSFADCCTPACALSKVRKGKAKKRAAEKVERAQIKARKKALMSLAKCREKAQKPFRAWVRMRDADLPCISCGVINPPMKPGGQWDAGHFLGRGAYPELAFNEDNCHKQCKSCNAGGGKFAHKERTVNAQYEINLIERIGAERVAALKAPHPPLHYSREDYEELERTYKQKLKELKK